jgi:hypothetical protein
VQLSPDLMRCFYCAFWVQGIGKLSTHTIINFKNFFMSLQKITIDPEKTVLFAFGKNISLDNDIEVEFSFNNSGRTFMTFTDQRGAAKRIRVETKKPDETPTSARAEFESAPEEDNIVGYIRVYSQK